MTSVKLTALFLALLLAVSLAACGNPIRDVVIGKDPVINPAPHPPPAPPPQPPPEENRYQRRARLIKKMEDIFCAAEPMENYSFTLNDPVTVDGREYYYGVWHRTITDYDTQSQYLSTVAEFFITPDGEECYIGYYYPANEGNGATVVLTPGNIFEEINNA